MRYVLSSILTSAVQYGLLTKNPVLGIKLHRDKRPAARVLVRRVGKSTIIDTLIKIKPQPPTTAGSDELRNDPLAKSVRYANSLFSLA
jgi:hypothetical protein